jgi:hypothetical protein
MRRLLTSVPGVSEFKCVRSDDDRFSFVYLGRSCVVHEPFGDNSRYWIGPVENYPPIDMAPVQEAFSRFQLFRVSPKLGMVATAWMIVLVLCGLAALTYFLLIQWYGSRPVHAGDAPVFPRLLSFCLDYLFALWVVLPELACAVSIFTAFVTWRSFFRSRKMPAGPARRGLLAFGGIVASTGSLVLLSLILPLLPDSNCAFGNVPHHHVSNIVVAEQPLSGICNPSRLRRYVEFQPPGDPCSRSFRLGFAADSVFQWRADAAPCLEWADVDDSRRRASAKSCPPTS